MRGARDAAAPKAAPPPPNETSGGGVRVYLRLLGYVRPYRTRFAIALACMVVFAATSTFSISAVSPFLQLLFAHPSGRPGTSVGLHLGGMPWLPHALRATLEQTLLDPR